MPSHTSAPSSCVCASSHGGTGSLGDGPRRCVRSTRRTRWPNREISSSTGSSSQPYARLGLRTCSRSWLRHLPRPSRVTKRSRRSTLTWPRSVHLATCVFIAAIDAVARPVKVAAMDDDLDERQTVDGVAVLPTTADAVSASVACARALGLPADDPEVIAEGYSVRVRLRPAPVVTRVVTVGRALRPHPLPWLEREVLVAQFLAASGVPIVAPWEDPGPHIAEGLEVCLWHWTEHDSREVSAAGFGAMLGPLHDALARYPGDLPTLIGPLTDISPALAISSDPTLHRAAAELVPLTRSWPARPLHGDAHTGNVLMTPDGPLWTDFEDVCVGPVEWDMASMTITDDALAAYPGPSTGPDSPTAVTCAVCRSSPASWSGTTTTLRSTRRWSRTSTDASTTDPACEGGPTGRSLRGTTARPGCRCRVPKRPSPATTAGTKTREAAAPSSCQPGDDRLPVRDRHTERDRNGMTVD